MKQVACALVAVLGLGSSASAQSRVADAAAVRTSLVGTAWLVGFDPSELPIVRRPDPTSKNTIRVTFRAQDLSVSGPCGVSTGQWTVTDTLRLETSVPEFCRDGSQQQATTIALLRRGFTVDAAVGRLASFRSPVELSPYFFRVPATSPSIDLTTNDWTPVAFSGNPVGPLPVSFRFRTDGIVQVNKPCNSRFGHWLVDGATYSESFWESTAVGCIGGFAADAVDGAIGGTKSVKRRPDGSIIFTGDGSSLALGPLWVGGWLTGATYSHQSGAKLEVEQSGQVVASLRCGTLQTSLQFDSEGNASLNPQWTGGTSSCERTLRQTLRSFAQPIRYPALLAGTGWKRIDGGLGAFPGTRWRRDPNQSTDQFNLMPDQLRFGAEGLLSTSGADRNGNDYQCTYRYRVMQSGSMMTQALRVAPGARQCDEPFPITSFRLTSKTLEIDAVRGIARYKRVP
jgi:hypothetical protein